MLLFICPSLTAVLSHYFLLAAYSLLIHYCIILLCLVAPPQILQVTDMWTADAMDSAENEDEGIRPILLLRSRLV